ncbi:hypothetical protein [Keratinibaculum paraultunense]|nr:hypothetical protein [Keratinibaculum paraultunense]QQY80600.1 hypothetical protein JL105_04685 [Keratinibaculum paraultunense]
MIMNSSQNNVQAFYVAEGKILMAINNPKYFDNLILPEIKEYLKNDKIIDNNKEYIVLDDEDLMEGDSDNKINLFFYEEENREKLKLQTQTSYNKIKRKADANLTVINQLFEMGLPILSPNLLEGNAKLYEEYMDFLQQKIYIPTLEEDIMPIEIDNYEIIKIFNDMDRRTYVELYRNNISSSINKRLIDIKDRVFILVRNNKIKGTKMVIESNNINDILELKGIIYVEGDIYICSDVIFDGILIVNNGSIYIESDSNFMLSGILLGDDADKMLYDKRVKLDYNLHEIKRNGVYLPGFIEPNIEYIKIY